MGSSMIRTVPSAAATSSKRLRNGVAVRAVAAVVPGRTTLLHPCDAPAMAPPATIPTTVTGVPLLYQGGAEQDGARRDAQRDGHEILRAVQDRDLVRHDLHQSQHEQHADKPGVREEREAGAVQIRGAEPLIARKEPEESNRKEGPEPTQGGEPGSHAHLGEHAVEKDVHGAGKSTMGGALFLRGGRAVQPSDSLQNNNR